MKRVAMLRSGLDHSMNHFCLPHATPAAFPARKCNSHIQTRGATPLILHCYTGCTKLLANQLPSAPRTGWDPPSSPDNPKAPSVLPKTSPQHFLHHLLWQSPGLALWVFQWGGLKLVQGWTTVEREQQLAAQHLALLLIYSPLCTHGQQHMGLVRATNGTAHGSGVPQGQERQGHIFWGVLQPCWQLV